MAGTQGQATRQQAEARARELGEAIGRGWLERMAEDAAAQEMSEADAIAEILEEGRYSVADLIASEMPAWETWGDEETADEAIDWAADRIREMLNNRAAAIVAEGFRWRRHEDAIAETIGVAIEDIAADIAVAMGEDIPEDPDTDTVAQAEIRKVAEDIVRGMVR